MTISNMFTDARLAAWQAIDNYSETSSLFKQTYRYAGAGEPPLGPSSDPEYLDGPAIALFPLSAAPEWRLHLQMFIPFTIDVRIWTPGWLAAEAEEAMVNVRDAFYKTSYIKDTTCYVPEQFGRISFDQVHIGEDRSVEFIRGHALLVLKLKDNPLS